MVRQLTSSDLLITRIDGKNYAYIKPEVGDFDADRSIKDFSFSGSSQFGRLLLGTGAVEVEKAIVSSTKIGMKVYNDADVHVFDYQFYDTKSPTRFSVGIRVDENHVGSAEFLRMYGNGLDNPSKPTDNLSINTDFLTLNNTSNKAGSVYIRDVTTKNFSDSGIDVKNDIYIMNATISDSFRGLKVYNGATVTIVNSEISSVKGGELIKLFGKDSTVRYYNTTWDGESAPDSSKIGFANVPHYLQGAVRNNNIVALKENPLPKLDDFFTVDNAQYKAQISVNGGKWVDLDLPSNGFLSKHVGDTLIDLPNLGSGSYQIRAWTVEGGQTGATAVSQVYKLKGDGFAASVAPPAAETPTDEVAPPPPPQDVSGTPVTGNSGVDTVDGGRATADGGLVLVAGKGGQLIVTTGGGDVVTTGYGHDLILFDTSRDIGDDTITDFNRSRDALLFTEFVDLGDDNVHRLDSSGRFDLDDRALDANGGSIALGSNLGDRYVHYAGETADGLHLYEVWNNPWSEIGG